MGSIVYPCTLPPRNDLSVTALNSWIRSTYGSSVIDAYYYLGTSANATKINPQLSNDRLHPNNFGQMVLGAAVYSKIGDVFKNRLTPFSLPTLPKRNVVSTAINRTLS
jgi:lysophospholipase L1-like esterase